MDIGLGTSAWETNCVKNKINCVVDIIGILVDSVYLFYSMECVLAAATFAFLDGGLSTMVSPMVFSLADLLLLAAAVDRFCAVGLVMVLL
jgi:hypothetical protein